MNSLAVGTKALLLALALMFQGIMLAAVPPAEAATTDGGSRLPTGYLVVFHDDFQAGVIDPDKWSHWEGMWSTDNAAKNPSGGIYQSEEVYLTESPYPNDFGHPLDDNGNGGFYLPDETAMIETVWIDLANLTMPRLEFEQMYEILSRGDGAMVYIMTERDHTWKLLHPETPYTGPAGWTGTYLTWQQVSIRLDEYKGHRVRFAFRFHSTPDKLEGDGWKIDDVTVGGKPDRQLADLKLGNVRTLLHGISVENAVAGDVLELNITIMNDGRAHTGPFVVSAYTDHPLIGGDLIGRRVFLQGLAVGESRSIVMGWVAIPGSYDLLIIMDENNQVPEEDELQNERRLHLDVDDSSAGEVALLDMHFEADGSPITGAEVGDLIEIVAIVANLGTSFVPTPMMVSAYDEPPEASADVIGDDQPKISGLEPGQERTIRIKWRPLAGDHTIYLLVAPEDPAMTLDFNTENNMTSASLVVTDDPPVDLVVEQLTFLLNDQTITTASEGDNILMQGTISNQGVAPFEGIVTVGFYRGDPDAGGVGIGTRPVIGTIGPGEQVTVEIDWRAELGTHALTVAVDPDNTVYESDEYDNQLGKGLTVSRRPLPDLAVSAMSLLLNGVELDVEVGTNEGASVEINVTVQNLGIDSTKSVTTAAVYLGNPELDHELLGTISVPDGLNPDERFSGSVFWEARRPAIKSEVPVIFVVVDDGGIEQEADEFNNAELRLLRVGPAFPDLTVYDLAITDGDGQPVDTMTFGSSVDIEVTVKNIGTDVSFQAATVDIYLDEVDPSNVIQTLSTSALGVGEEARRSYTWKPEATSVQGGRHTIIAVVDPLFDIEESSDANNMLSAPLEIDASALPNLLLMDVWVTKGSTIVDRLHEGEKATIHLRVLNLGDAPLYTTTSVEVFHGDPTTGGDIVGFWQLTDLPVMGNTTFEATWTFKREDPLMVFIDRNNAVREGNELDNIETYQVRIDPAPEGANYLLMAALVAVGLVVLLMLTVLIRRRPEGPAGDIIEPTVTPTRSPELEELLATKPPKEAKPAEPEPPEEAAEPGPPEEAAEPEPVEEAAEPEPVEEAAEPGPVEVAAEPEPVEVAAEPEPAEVKASVRCPSCGQRVEPGWILCPECETVLR